MASAVNTRIPPLKPRPAEFVPFPLFDGFRRDESVEPLAGPADLPPFMRPVQLTLVPDKVSSFAELIDALFNADSIEKEL